MAKNPEFESKIKRNPRTGEFESKPDSRPVKLPERNAGEEEDDISSIFPDDDTSDIDPFEYLPELADTAENFSEEEIEDHIRKFMASYDKRLDDIEAAEWEEWEEQVREMSYSEDRRDRLEAAGLREAGEDALRRLACDEDAEVASTASDSLKKWYNVHIHTKSRKDIHNATTEQLQQQLANLSIKEQGNPEYDAIRTELCRRNIAKNPVPYKRNELIGDLSADNAGATWSPLTGLSPAHGFCFSPYEKISKVIDSTDPAEIDDAFDRFAEKHRDLLSKPDHYMGLWRSDKDHKLYLDVSVAGNSAEEARRKCLAHDQQAFFDLQTLKSVTVNPKAKSGQDRKEEDNDDNEQQQ